MSFQYWLFCAVYKVVKVGTCVAFCSSWYCWAELRTKPSRYGGINQERKCIGMLHFYKILIVLMHIGLQAGANNFFYFYFLSPVVRIHHGSFEKQTPRMYSFVNNFSMFLYVFVFWQLRCFYFSTQKANLLQFLSLLTSTSFHIQPSVFQHKDTWGFLCYMYFGNMTHYK